MCSCFIDVLIFSIFIFSSCFPLGMGMFWWKRSSPVWSTSSSGRPARNPVQEPFPQPRQTGTAFTGTMLRVWSATAKSGKNHNDIISWGNYSPDWKRQSVTSGMLAQSNMYLAIVSNAPTTSKSMSVTQWWPSLCSVAQMHHFGFGVSILKNHKMFLSC